MDYLSAVIFSIVEGLSEFLPISSTGHLILTAKLLNIPQTDFVKSFQIIIQLGAILAVVILYWKTILTDRKALARVIIAFLPTAVLGLIFYDFIKEVLLGSSFVVVVALFLGGIVLIVWEKFYKEMPHHSDKISKLSYKQAVLVGVFQSVSMIPGVSRAGATIIGGLTVGLKRKPAVEFSFLLAIPTMAAATGLDLLKTNLSFSPYEWSVLAVGLIGSFIFAMLAVKFFIRFIESHTFIPFGIYRIILSILFFIFII